METEERPSKIRKVDDADQASYVSRQNSGSSTEIITEPGRTQMDAVLDASFDPKSSLQEDGGSEVQPMSKNAKKRLARQIAWEEGRDLRRQRRKEKQIARRERRKVAQVEIEHEIGSENKPATKLRPSLQKPINIPLTFLVDCGFDEQMTEKEIVSISAQVTRCYSENRKALYRPQLAISSFGGRLQNRFETVLRNPHARWTNFHLDDCDFVAVAEKAKAMMLEIPTTGLEECPALKGGDSATPDNGEIVYLTADSDQTLEELRPYSTYIVGGIVDRNRHKGICYKRANDQGIKTAKLPIGEFMQMSSRAVLATNHVYEIMLRWLETKDWGEAFMKVIPKRKGGILKNSMDNAEGRVSGEDSDEGDDIDHAGGEPQTLVHAD